MSNERRRGGYRGDSSATPPDELPTPENTARRFVALRRYLQGADQLAEQMGRLVLEGGFDSRTVAVMEEAVEHLEDLSDISAGNALSLRRFLKSL